MNLRGQAVALRRQGKMYAEIERILRKRISKSTLSYWCKGVPLPGGYGRKLKLFNLANLERARQKAAVVNRVKRQQRIEALVKKNKHLADFLDNQDAAKVALAILYLAEGSKTTSATVVFGNADPFVITLFLRLLRFCFVVDESKLRCTVQCRADQNIPELEHFWSKLTKIPPRQFYPAQIDPRTKGKPTRKKDYRGVCRIVYFSAPTFYELQQIVTIIHAGR